MSISFSLNSLLGRIQSPVLRSVVAFVGGALGLATVAFALPSWIPAIPPRFWQLVALCIAGLAILWWFTAGSRRYAQAGRSRKRIGDLGPGNPEDEREPLQRMQRAIREAKHAIARSPEMGGGRNSLYRVPWLLMLGDADADMGDLLRAGSATSPFPAPAGTVDESIWRWWFFKSMIAIEVSPRLVCDAGARLERGLWYQALLQLAAEREMLPVNGIVVGIGARSLLGDAEALKATCMRLRRMVDEAMEHLQVLPPVYFVVTGLAKLPGYDKFRGALPQEAFGQALGFRMPVNEAVSADTSGRLDAILGPVFERLHALRMTALLAQGDAPGRAGVFEFVQSVSATGTGLHSFVSLLLEDNPFQRTPRWRGLYFTGAPAAGSTGGAFVDDLFTRFFPADQPLATTTLKSSGARVALAGVGVAALLGFSTYLSYGLAQAHRDDAQLLAQTQTACAGRQSAGAGRRIGWVAACGLTIERLESSADSGLLGFGLRRSDRDIAALQRQVVADFSDLILAPYDQMLDADMARGDVGIEHVLAVAQRLRILSQCRRHAAACTEHELPFNVVFDPRSRLFAPFASSERDTRADRENADALMATYLGYLRWQKGALLDREQHRLEAQFERLIEQHPLRTSDLERWADARADGIRVAGFWLPADRVIGVDDRNLPTVSAACTSRSWNGIVAPLLATAGDVLPKKKTLLADFRASWFTACFDQWARFQAGFGNGVSLWRGHYGELTQRAAGADNPYNRYFVASRENLLGLPLKLGFGQRWALARFDMGGHWFVSWKPIFRAIGATIGGWFTRGRIDPPTWLAATLQSTTGVLAKQQVLFANGYLRLQAQAADQDLYQIAAAYWQAKGAPQQPPAADYAKLVDALAKPDDRFAAKFQGQDLAAWSVVQGPARLLLQLTLDRAAHFVQQHWANDIARPLAALPPAEQVAALYGDKGKLNGFVNDWLRPFVTEREHAPVLLDGVALPLTDGFRGMIAQQGRFQSLLDSSQPFQAATLTFTGASQLGALVEGPQGTSVEVSCQSRTFNATDKAQSLAGASVAVFWSPAQCPQASLRIDIATPSPGESVSALVDAAAARKTAAPAPPPPITLVKLYQGSDGFVQLVRDFKSGMRAFGPDDFRDAYTPEQWGELSARLRAAGFLQARVYLQVQPTPQMEQYMAARSAPVALPTTIVE